MRAERLQWPTNGLELTSRAHHRQRPTTLSSPAAHSAELSSCPRVREGKLQLKLATALLTHKATSQGPNRTSSCTEHTTCAPYLGAIQQAPLVARLRVTSFVPSSRFTGPSQAAPLLPPLLPFPEPLPFSLFAPPFLPLGSATGAAKAAGA